MDNSYKTSKNKVKTLWEQTLSNEFTINKSRKNIIQFRTTTNIKRTNKVKVFEDYSYINHYNYSLGLATYTDPLNFELSDIEFPEWIIPYIKIVLYFKTEIGWVEYNTSMGNYSFSYFFIKIIDQDTYRLSGRLVALHYYQSFSTKLPLYVNLDVYVMNPKLNYELQTKKT